MVDLRAAFVADEQPLELVEMGEGALDDPAVAAESGAVLGLSARDQRQDAALADEAPVFVVVVTAVGDHRVRSPPRSATQTRDRRDSVKLRDQLRDVVAVAARERPRERDPAAVYEEMVLAARPAAIDRAGTRFGAPFFACR